MNLEAVIFDVDGVLVDSPHEQAWRETLQELMEGAWRDLAGATGYAPERFTKAVYQLVVAGKPRESGARAALEYFGVPDAGARARVYGEKKQAALMRLIEAGKVAAFPDGVRFAQAVRALGLGTAVASSSRNAGRLLERIRVGEKRFIDLFDVNVCGLPLARGKPDPEIFLTAAEALRAAPERCVVVEDAPAGVQAAKAGGMTALGVARVGDEALLEAAGADEVVSSLDEVAPEGLAAGRLTRRAA